MVNSHVSLCRATVEDAKALADLTRATFCETFGHLYKPEDLAAYLASAYTPDIQRTELADPRKWACLAKEASGKWIGHVMTGPCKLPVEDADQAMEIYRIYVLSAFHGKGIGRQLMDAAMAQLGQTRQPIYLGVWEDNVHAQAFYQGYGFTVCGEYRYPVGNHEDRELIMRCENRAG